MPGVALHAPAAQQPLAASLSPPLGNGPELVAGLWTSPSAGDHLVESTLANVDFSPLAAENLASRGDRFDPLAEDLVFAQYGSDDDAVSGALVDQALPDSTSDLTDLARQDVLRTWGRTVRFE